MKYYRIMHDMQGIPQRVVMRVDESGDEPILESYEYVSNSWIPAGALWAKVTLGGEYDAEEVSEEMARAVIESNGGRL